jgi:oxazoline/thiazoline synthase
MLRIVDHYLVPSDGGATQLRSARNAIRLRGRDVQRIVLRVLPLLDGTRSADQIVDALKEAIAPRDVRAVLDLLGNKSFIERVDPVDEELLPPQERARLDALASYLHDPRLGDTRYRGIEALRRARVLLAGEALPDGLAPALTHAGVGDVRSIAASDDEDAWACALDSVDAAVLWTRGAVWLDERVDAINAAAVRARTPWLICTHASAEAFQIGPTIYPEETACTSCIRRSWRRNTAFLRPHGAADADLATPSPAMPSRLAVQLALGVATIEVLRLLSRLQAPISTSRIVTLDLATLQTETFDTIKEPRCPVCGPARNRPMMRIWG